MIELKRFREPLLAEVNGVLTPTLKDNDEEPRGAERLSKIVLIEKRPLLRECFCYALRSNTRNSVTSYSSIEEWRDSSPDVAGSMVILSTVTLSLEEIRRELLALSGLGDATIIVLAANDEPSRALDALLHGAKGYMSSDVSLDFAMKTMHFVSAGGTYIPAGCLTGAQTQTPPASANTPNGPFTGRELAVIQLIRQGKSNKMIANTLNMCESTVKVHVRHIMKKTRTKNRTELAMMSSGFVGGLAEH